MGDFLSRRFLRTSLRLKGLARIFLRRFWKSMRCPNTQVADGVAWRLHTARCGGVYPAAWRIALRRTAAAKNGTCEICDRCGSNYVDSIRPTLAQKSRLVSRP